MAFLDNSGDIILDAVLTDTGRLRLAQGDGSFKISKFALGDDEINYALYNKNHASGSAYFDLEILQTPVLEAITNNSSQIKSRLMTISRTNLLFLPTFKLNTNDAPNFTAQHGDSRLFFRSSALGGDLTQTQKTDAKFYVAVDQFTQEAIMNSRGSATSNSPARGNPIEKGNVRGVLQGFTTGGNSNLNPAIIRVDQGLDTTEISPAIQLDADMLETAFLVELDYRLGRVKEPTAAEGLAAFNFVDDDNVASYYLTQEGLYVNPIANYAPKNNNLSEDDAIFDANDPQVFNGPRGNTLHMRIQASQELQSSTYLFTQIGRNDAVGSDVLGLASNDPYVTGKRVYYIDSTVRVIGANTGFRLDIPVRYVKIK
jgi:hypothetical protein